MMPVERLSCVSPKASRESIALLKSLTPVCTQPHTPPYHSVAAGEKAERSTRRPSDAAYSCAALAIDIMCYAGLCCPARVSTIRPVELVTSEEVTSCRQSVARMTPLHLSKPAREFHKPAAPPTTSGTIGCNHLGRACGTGSMARCATASFVLLEAVTHPFTVAGCSISCSSRYVASACM